MRLLVEWYWPSPPLGGGVVTPAEAAGRPPPGLSWEPEATVRAVAPAMVDAYWAAQAAGGADVAETGSGSSSDDSDAETGSSSSSAAAAVGLTTPAAPAVSSVVVASRWDSRGGGGGGSSSPFPVRYVREVCVAADRTGDRCGGGRGGGRWVSFYERGGGLWAGGAARCGGDGRRDGGGALPGAVMDVTAEEAAAAPSAAVDSATAAMWPADAQVGVHGVAGAARLGGSKFAPLAATATAATAATAVPAEVAPRIGAPRGRPLGRRLAAPSPTAFSAAAAAAAAATTDAFAAAAAAAAATIPEGAFFPFRTATPASTFRSLSPSPTASSRGSSDSDYEAEGESADQEEEEEEGAAAAASGGRQSSQSRSGTGPWLRRSGRHASVARGAGARGSGGGHAPRQRPRRTRHARHAWEGTPTPEVDSPSDGKGSGGDSPMRWSDLD
ncbi:hypothetical protein I4F81_008274 [Pyropia yezoensis]|uniref:Uncharacterized protein n=1 Tax=Pyropia yezoensis TaxID=2788 RepID=A0ACC3C712_PYRYE|nr:hypothetical protein I4F81_008274 [Neopyropia yezoensis]